MIDVKMALYDNTEIELFAAFTRAVEQHRASTNVVCETDRAVKHPQDGGIALFGGVGAPPNFPPFVSRDDHPPRPTPEPTREVLDRPVVASPAHAAPYGEQPTQVQLEDALRAYGQAKGFPAARALLDEYTKGKLGDVPAEKRAELYAKLVAA